jgi:hypothetical protein
MHPRYATIAVERHNLVFIQIVTGLRWNDDTVHFVPGANDSQFNHL